MSTSAIRDTGQGGDYTSIAAWESATDNDLVTATEGETGELYADKTWAENTTIAGATTNSTYYRILRAASGERHDGTSGGGGVVIDPTASGHAFTIQEDHFRLEYLRITGLVGSSDEAARVLADEVYIDKCVIHDLNTSNQDGVYFGFSDSNTRTIYVRNCVFYDIHRTAVHMQNVGNKSIFVHNCTGYNLNSGNGSDYCGFGADSGRSNSGSVMECKNVFSDANQACFRGATGQSCNVTNVASTDGTATNVSNGTESGTNQANLTASDEFVSLTGGSEDFDLLVTSNLIEAGTDLDTDADLPVTDDIIDTSRDATTPDVGAFEYAAAGAGLPIPVVYHHRNRI